MPASACVQFLSISCYLVSLNQTDSTAPEQYFSARLSIVATINISSFVPYRQPKIRVGYIRVELKFDLVNDATVFNVQTFKFNDCRCQVYRYINIATCSRTISAS